MEPTFVIANCKLRDLAITATVSISPNQPQTKRQPQRRRCTMQIPARPEAMMNQDGSSGFDKKIGVQEMLIVCTELSESIRSRIPSSCGMSRVSSKEQ
jgi:hypothetical protein